MATTYNLETYDSSVLPKGLHKTAADLTQGALAIGWTVVVKGVTARLVSPDGKKSLVLSASGKNIPWERYKRIILSHGNPLLIPGNDERVQAHAADIVRAENIAIQKREAREAEAKTEAAERAEAAAKEAKPAPPKKVSAQKPEPKPEPAFISADEDLDLDARYVVSEHPMVAYKGQRTGYVSPTTNEREWSDGTTDYTCRSKNCDYSTPDRTGVGRHWRTHVRAGEEQSVEQPRDNIRIPPHDPVYDMSYTPRRERVSALAQVLAALDVAAMSPEELAEFVLNWQHTQSDTGTRLAAEREELTSDEVLLRIRALLDNGTYLAQQEQIDALRAETDALDQSLTDALARAQQAEERWTTLRELIAMDETVSA